MFLLQSWTLSGITAETSFSRAVKSLVIGANLTVRLGADRVTLLQLKYVLADSVAEARVVA